MATPQNLAARDEIRKLLSHSFGVSMANATSLADSLRQQRPPQIGERRIEMNGRAYRVQVFAPVPPRTEDFNRRVWRGMGQRRHGAL